MSDIVPFQSYFSNPAEAFRDAMLAAGLAFDGEVIADGQRHRFKTQGDRAKNSWYLLHLDGLPAGAFGCWKRGFKETWRAGGTESISEIDRIERDRKIAQKKAKSEQEQRRKHQSAAQTAQAILDRSAIPADDSHPYLQRKSVRAYPGTRIGYWPQRNKANCLLIPLRDIDGNLKSLEAIYADKPTAGRKNKDFLSGGEKQGAHFTIGNPASSDALVFGEGYSTCATIYEATGYCVIAAMDAGNLLAVALAYRERYPEKPILFAADNDRHNKAGNVGIIKATAAALAVNGLLAIPVFADDEKGSDFNDLAALYGLDAVRKAIENAKPVSADAVALCERSDFDGDIKRLAKAPESARLATARAIANKYTWHSPWKRSYSELNAAISANLNRSEKADIARLIEWHELKARCTALDGTRIEAEALRGTGIDVVEVGSISEAYALAAAHPEALVLVKAALGSGKTSGILKPISDLTNATTVAITNRTSLVADLSSRLKLDRYDETPAKATQSCTELGICLKSITNPKFAEVLGRARMVLVDEISAVVRECHEPDSHGVLGKSAKMVWEKLGVLLRNADKGACGVDADLCTADVLALKDLMQGHRPIRVIVVKPVKTQLDIAFTKPYALLSDLLTAVARGEKCRIFSDSAKKVREWAALLKKSYPHLSVMAIHSQGATATTGSPEVQAALADINTAVHSIDVLLHTPAVESGVSLTVPHFGKTFGLYCGTVAPAAFIQMLRRDRTAKSATIAVMGNGIRFDKTDCAQILNDMGDAHRITVATAASEGRYSMTFEPATRWDERVAQYRAASNRKTNNYAASLWFQLEAMGATVRLDGDAMAMPLKDVLEAKSAAADLAKDEDRTAILTAPDITERDRDEIQRQYQPTPEQCASAERYDLKQTLAVREVDAAALDLWHEGRVRGPIERFEALTAAPLAGLATDAVEAAAQVPLAARSNRLAEAEAIKTAFECFGFDLCTGQGEITEESAREAFENLKASPLRPVLEHSGLLRLDRMPKYPVRWVGDFLGRLGLTLELAEQRGPRGNRERYYRITQGETWDKAGRWMTAPGWLKMASICARRLDRCTHEPISNVVLPHVCTADNCEVQQ